MKPITERPIFAIVNIIYILLLVNFYFVVANPLFFYLYLFAPVTLNESLLVFASAITMGPAFGATFFVMGKLVREGDVSPTKDFWRGYKMNFWVSLKYWAVQLVVLFIIFFNLTYIFETGEFSTFSWFFILLFALVFSLNFYAFSILSRFGVTVKNLWIYTVINLIKKWRLTIFNLTTLLACYLIYITFPAFTSLFFMSGVVYFIAFNNKKLLQEMEEAT